MFEKPLPEIGKPYSTPQGFTMWRPQFSTMVVIPCSNGERDVVFTQGDMRAICFTLNDQQRDEFVALLMAQAPANIAQPATENVATQGASHA